MSRNPTLHACRCRGQKHSRRGQPRGVCEITVSAAPPALNLIFGAAQGWLTLSCGGAQATRRARRRGLAAYPRPFARLTARLRRPPCGCGIPRPRIPACHASLHRTETPPEALRARAFQPQNEAAPKSRFNLNRRERHGSRIDRRHKHRGASPHTQRPTQKQIETETTHHVKQRRNT